MSDPSPLAQLGLPATWVPAPLGYSFAKFSIQTPDGNQTMHLLVIDGPSGRQAFAFDADSLRQLAERALEQTTGLTIASTVEQNGEGQWPPPR